MAKNKVVHKIPEMAKLAYASASETFKTQEAIVQGDYRNACDRITSQVMTDMALDGSKKDYIVNFEKGVIEEYPLGAKIRRPPPPKK